MADADSDRRLMEVDRLEVARTAAEAQEARVDGAALVEGVAEAAAVALSMRHAFCEAFS